jgi:16S rRNA (guanine527-N7)-methyltransferase
VRDLLRHICKDEQHADEAFDKVYEFHQWLMQESEKFNLTAIRDEQEAALKHYFDSLWPLKSRDVLLSGKCSVIDIGTGAGLPGLPIAVARPEANVTLLDATRKRCNFLIEAQRRLGLGNVVVLWGRAEDMGRDPRHRDRYDAALSRALAPLPVLVELTAPFVRPGGRILAWKGPQADQEINEAQKALRELKCEIKELVGSTLADTDIISHVVVIEKTGPTPEKYPRRAGVPKKKPLI